MKILVIGPDFFNYTSSLENAFQQLGHQTKAYTYRNFPDDCSYLAKKLERWGITSLREKYYQEWNEQVATLAQTWNPDVIVVLNGEYLSNATMEQLKTKQRKTILWLVDSILRFRNIEKLINYYDAVFSFDPRDEHYLLNKYNIKCPYLPVGYDPVIYHPATVPSQDIDVCFIGNATGNRIVMLQQVAEYMKAENKKMFIAGKFWDDRYFWKKRRFAQKYPYLHLFLHNHIIAPTDVCKLYQRSKICLNIHIEEHEGINPRTFEIMGTKSMELVDNKPKLADLVDIGNDVAVYQEASDLINKIGYYLKNNDERKAIAEAGHKKASTHFTIKHSVAVLLTSDQ